MRKSKNITGTKIVCEYDSSNIKSATYDTANKELEITFNSNSTYIYEGVTHEAFTTFDMSESQGKHFNQNINKKFNFRKKP